MERNGEILVLPNHSIVYVKKGFLDKLEMTKTINYGKLKFC